MCGQTVGCPEETLLATQQNLQRIIIESDFQLVVNSIMAEYLYQKSCGR